MKIEEVEKIDLSNLSNAELDELLKYVEKRADEEAYCMGIQYNVRDVELVKRLDNKLQLIALALSLTYQAKIRHEDHFFQVRMWDTLIYNKLLSSNVVVPPNKSSSKDEKYAGAVVFDPQVGIHDWIVSADLNSLYPSLMRHYNISPEKLVTRSYLESLDNQYSRTLLEYYHDDRDKLNVWVDDFIDGKENDVTKAVKELDISLAANGVMYHKDSQGFLPQLMEEIYGKRSEMKRKMLEAEQNYEDTKDPKYKNDIAKYKAMQLSYKTLLNSCYGAIGNNYFRLYNVDMAESITISGQLSIQWIQRKINSYLNKIFKTDDVNYIVAGDTDSFYMTLAKFVEIVTDGKEYDKIKMVDVIDDFFESKIQPEIDKAYNELSVYMNSFEQQMIMKREVIADRGFWRAKKNYALNVYDSEGVRYEKPKLKIMGIEAIKSSTPELCRDALKESIRIILQETEKDLQSYIANFKKKFYNANIDLISFPRGVSDIKKWDIDSEFGFKSKTPIHVKGSISYNRMLKKHNLLGSYREIKNGDKIKFIYLNDPNPLHSNSISYPDVLPVEFALDNYIDYALQYKISFVQPIESITQPIGWSIEKKNSLF